MAKWKPIHAQVDSGICWQLSRSNWQVNFRRVQYCGPLNFVALFGWTPRTCLRLALSIGKCYTAGRLLALTLIMTLTLILRLAMCVAGCVYRVYTLVEIGEVTSNTDVHRWNSVEQSWLSQSQDRNIWSCSQMAWSWPCTVIVLLLCCGIGIADLKVIG